MNADVVIVGAGPSGIFTALRLVELCPDRHIVMVEKGLPVERRHCPKDKVGHCVGCTPCRITTGFSGAGAFSDGKLSLSYEVGGDLPELIGADLAQKTINDVDQIYLAFGADDHVEGLDQPESIRKIRLRAIQAGLKLVDCPIRHLGTEKAQEIYGRIEQYLLDHGVEILFNTDCRDLVIEDDVCCGIVAEGPEGELRINARAVIVATGRRGADWLEHLCSAHGISHQPGAVDMGVRVETDLRNEKIGYKIREAQSMKIPYMLVVGDKEAADGTVSVRARSGGDKGVMSFDDFAGKLMGEIERRDIELSM